MIKIKESVRWLFYKPLFMVERGEGGGVNVHEFLISAILLEYQSLVATTTNNTKLLGFSRNKLHSENYLNENVFIFCMLVPTWAKKGSTISILHPTFQNNIIQIIVCTCSSSVSVNLKGKFIFLFDLSKGQT